jgi:hypothetical protein
MTDPLAHVPSVAYAPPARCYFRAAFPHGSVCGEIATVARPGNHWFATEYFCDRHRGPADVSIAAVHVFRRVRLSLDVLFAGVHYNAPIAHTEAVARIERALLPIGGLLDIKGVSSSVVKSSPEPGRAGAIGAVGDPE